MKKIMIVILATTFLISSIAFVVSSSAATNTGSYVVFGDSIAAGYGLTEANNINTKDINYVADIHSNAYCGIVARSLGMSLTNYARSGATSTDLLVKLQNGQILANLKSADLVTVSIGGNDLIGISGTVLPTAALYEFMSSMGVSVSRTTEEIEAMYDKLESNLVSIMSTIVSNCPNGKVMLQSLYNPYKASPTYSFSFMGNTYIIGDLIDYYINRINEVYRNVQKKVGHFIICDTATAMNNDSRCFYEVSSPDFHPTNYGHTVIANTILASLSTVPTNTKSSSIPYATFPPIQTAATTKATTSSSTIEVTTEPTTEATTTTVEITTVPTTETSISTTEETTVQTTEITTATVEFTTETTIESETTSFENTSIEKTIETTLEPSVEITTESTPIERTGCKSIISGIEITLIASAICLTVIFVSGGKKYDN